MAVKPSQDDALQLIRTQRMMVRMTARERTTISLPADLMAAAKAASGGNLSAYIEQVLRERQLRQAGAAIAVWRAGADADAEEIADTFGQDIA
jgi:hypothetical protein